VVHREGPGCCLLKAAGATNGRRSHMASCTWLPNSLVASWVRLLITGAGAAATNNRCAR
jgi:hypothetical protein